MERSLTDATVYGLAYLVTDVSVSIDNEFGVLRLRSWKRQGKTCLIVSKRRCILLNHCFVAL